MLKVWNRSGLLGGSAETGPNVEKLTKTNICLDIPSKA